jgi:DNA-binding CsgD family transcriptional regulator
MTLQLSHHESMAGRPSPTYSSWDLHTKIAYLEHRLFLLGCQLRNQECLTEARFSYAQALQEDYERLLQQLQENYEHLEGKYQKALAAGKELQGARRIQNRELKKRALHEAELESEVKKLTAMVRTLTASHEQNRNELVQGRISQWRDDVTPLLSRLRVLSTTEEQRVLVDSILLKLMEGVDKCSSGMGRLCSCLSEGEHEIALLVADGQSSKNIAKMLGISLREVQSHCYSIRRKLNLSAKTRLKNYLRQFVST